MFYTQYVGAFVVVAENIAFAIWWALLILVKYWSPFLDLLAIRNSSR